MATYNGDPQDYQPLVENGYEFDIGAYLKRGWDLFTQNVSGFIAYVFIFFIAAGIISQIGSMLGFGSPILTFITSQIANIPVVGLSAGFLIMAHKLATNQEAEFNTFFDGLKDMIQLWVASLVSGLLAMIPILIGFYLAIGDEMFAIYEMFQDTAALTEMVQDPEELLAFIAPFGAKLGIFGGIGVLVSILISTLYAFTQSFILFERLSFWDAMESSRKVISQKLLSFILLWLVLGISFIALCAIPAAIAGVTGSILLSVIAGFAIFAGFLVYFPYVNCVMYSAFEKIVLNNVDGGTMENFIDEIGSE